MTHNTLRKFSRVREDSPLICPSGTFSHEKPWEKAHPVGLLPFFGREKVAVRPDEGMLVMR
jgi:hypothetical protein